MHDQWEDDRQVPGLCPTPTPAQHSPVAVGSGSETGRGVRDLLKPLVQIKFSLTPLAKTRHSARLRTK